MFIGLLAIRFFIFCLSFVLFVCLSIYLPICLLFACLSVCLFFFGLSYCICHIYLIYLKIYLLWLTDWSIIPYFCFCFIVDGGFSHWNSWSTCHKSCGENSFRTRFRFCNNPPPSNGGKTCHGDRLQLSKCPIKPCTGTMKRKPENSEIEDVLYIPIVKVYFFAFSTDNSTFMNRSIA